MLEFIISFFLFHSRVSENEHASNNSIIEHKRKYIEFLYGAAMTYNP